uniref:Uncharacterized protein n=1 Tax=Arundo donax TaxID=35708 RepID=A0A0A9EJ09_ARUDO
MASRARVAGSRRQGTTATCARAGEQQRPDPGGRRQQDPQNRTNPCKQLLVPLDPWHVWEMMHMVQCQACSMRWPTFSPPPCLLISAQMCKEFDLSPF